MPPLTYANGLQAEYIDSLYQEYKKSPDSIDASWRSFFEGFDLAYQRGSNSSGTSVGFSKEAAVMQLIDYYRSRGHLFAKTNPIKGIDPHVHPEHRVQIEQFDLTEADLDSSFAAGTSVGFNTTATLREIISFLENTYCSSIGYEYKDLKDKTAMTWLQGKIEAQKKQPLGRETQISILEKLDRAALFEDFLHTKFVGKKRFSLEGGETLIPALHTLAVKGPALEVESIVIGMAHRGRINTLVNILGKPYADVFAEFDGKGVADSDPYGGDTSYHMGFENHSVNAEGRKLALILCPNPSHLEAVNAIVEGLSRALIDNQYGGRDGKLLPILIHGDAAVSAQGIVYEVTQMEDLPGYKTGGTLHVIINNFLGFTTSAELQKSSTYCSDIAKVVGSPVLHVNAMDPEAVVFATNLCLEYRQKFGKDIWIDLRCYRKYGHNEGDEPSFTQPALYKNIKIMQSVDKAYEDNLIQKGVITKGEALDLRKTIKGELQQEFEKAKSEDFVYEFKNASFNAAWNKIGRLESSGVPTSPSTKVKEDVIAKLAKEVFALPQDKKFVPKTIKLFQDRLKMAIEGDKFDWGMGEYLAYGSLLNEGVSVRVSGEDVGRGTFSHRHAVLKTEDGEQTYVPLEKACKKGAAFHIYNSLLSEYGVLGYEYGYALAEPNMLTIWEAQFGDFANGAQIIIDQYISSAFQKWKLSNGLVVLLPHGYEGQGPEHSSARIERYLELCANNNMFVANLTSPAQLFHALRRQIKADYRIPLIVFTPKSLLRHPACVSQQKEFTKGEFHAIIDDCLPKPKIRKVLVCSGKIYYDLLAYRQEAKLTDTAIIRLEQLYPLDSEGLKDILAGYKSVKKWFFVQEEPENMGPWPRLCREFRREPVEAICRPAASSPATGYMKNHAAQQKALVERAFKI